MPNTNMIDRIDFQTEDEKVLSFLEILLFKYRHNLLTDEEKRRIHSLYRIEMYNNRIEQDNDEKTLEYVSLGWYIHTFLSG